MQIIVWLREPLFLNIVVESRVMINRNFLNEMIRFLGRSMMDIIHMDDDTTLEMSIFGWYSCGGVIFIIHIKSMKIMSHFFLTKNKCFWFIDSIQQNCNKKCVVWWNMCSIYIFCILHVRIAWLDSYCELQQQYQQQSRNQYRKNEVTINTTIDSLSFSFVLFSSMMMFL